jgi:hypothetical protein
MPFLSDIAKNHYYQELENVVGYSFAIQSCMLSGKYPEENNHWMPYFYFPENSSMLFKTFGKVGAVFMLDKFPLLRYLATRLTRKFVLKEGVHSNNISFSVIDKISIYPYYYMCDLPFFHDLRALLEKKCQTPLTYIGPPKIKSHIYRTLLKYIEASNHEAEFIMVYDDKLDMLGHEFSPYSSECLRYVEFLDSALRIVYQKLKKRFENNLTFVIFSDHGQCEQTYSFNLLSELGKNGLNLGEDYLCFVDATLALFWPKNQTVKEKIVKILNRIKIGTVIDEALRERYHINFQNRKYGDIFFVLKPGGTFFPNFFSPLSTMKGLHGYLPEEEVQKSFLILNEKRSAHLSHIKDIRSFLLNLFS